MNFVTQRWKSLVSIAVFAWLFAWLAYSVSFENKHKYLPAFVLGEEVDFNTHIRPIFNKKCIACHGGVKKSGGFSLLFEDEALAVNESGKRAIVPGSVRKSELIKRITHHDPEYRMPLEGDPLEEEEVELLTKWINQGARWKDHWAYLPPAEQVVPRVSAPWVKNDIDRFILSKLQAEGLTPSPQADRYTLLRRLSFDLVGLPPTLEFVKTFEESPTDEMYERIVDSLLVSPGFGERWSAMWMDMARYADSKGYEADRPRSIWQYRDWLIKAFNDNMPFDRFITEQLAGDLLPDPTDDQYIATAFHRNTMNNDEGGTDNEEFRVAAQIDRVNTTWSVLQGTTMECVQCHSHPYDPIRHEDYFRFMAFFNQSADADVPSESPVLITYKQDEDNQKLDRIKDWVGTQAPASSQKQKVDYFEKLLRVGEPKLHPHYFEQIEKGLPVFGTSSFKVTDSVYTRMRDLPFTGKDRIMLRYRAGRSIGEIQLRLDSKDGDVIGKIPVERKFRTEYDKKEGKNKEYTIAQIVSFPIKPITGKRDLYMVLVGADGSGLECNIEWVLLHDALPGEGQPGFEEISREFYDLVNSTKSKTTTPIMVDLDEHHRRVTRVFEKGNWLVQGKEVSPGVPARWNQFEEDFPANRLGLAKWITAPDNPLTGRVMVNRIWEQLFGLGIVETLEDFGSQGFAPSHPELLDWLALHFIHDLQWDFKALIKTIVMSATYRQSSLMREDLMERDANNHLLARGPRMRLKAEQVRDQALAVSGLLSPKMFGPSVMPPQPDGIWQVVYNGGDSWKTSTGEDRYRRALYTFWRRTSPYPSFITFDAPSREFCLPRRIDTNTPLQALVSLNDPVYVEAATHLARQVIVGIGAEGDPGHKLELMYSLAMRRGIDPEKLEALQKLYEETLVYFDNEPSAICQLTGEEDKELAILTVVANVIMNLDEFVMKA